MIGGKFQWLNFLLFKDSFLTFKDSFSSFSKPYSGLNFNDSFSSFSISLAKYQNFNDSISPVWLNINDSFSTLCCIIASIFLEQMIWLQYTVEKFYDGYLESQLFCENNHFYVILTHLFDIGLFHEKIKLKVTSI